jgi:hypothetical protein
LCEAKSKLASLHNFFCASGSFTAEHTQFSSTLIGYYLLFFIKGGQMLAHFSCIQYYGRQQCHALFDQTTSDSWATHTETEGRGFIRSDAFSSEIHSASCKLYETQTDERSIILYVFYFFLVNLWERPGFP